MQRSCGTALTQNVCLFFKAYLVTMTHWDLIQPQEGPAGDGDSFDLQVGIIRPPV